MAMSTKHLPMLGLGLVAAWTTLAAGVQAESVEMHRSFLPPAAVRLFEGFDVAAILGGALALGSLGVLALRIGRRQRRGLRREIVGLTQGPRFNVVDAMAHCVWRAGKIDDTRLERALEIARNTTEMDYRDEHLREAALRADRFIGPMTFWHMREGMTRGERMVVFNSALSVLLADGPLTPGDRSMLKSLSRGLRLRRADLRDLGKLIPQ